LTLRGGRVVRLTEGRFDQEKSYGDDPLAVAKDFAAAGATWLHVVDLDGAKDPREAPDGPRGKDRPRQRPAALQTGGGIRDESQIAALLAAGAQRVIVGQRRGQTRPRWSMTWLPEIPARKRSFLSPDRPPRCRRHPPRGRRRMAGKHRGWRLDDFLTGFLWPGWFTSFAPTSAAMANLTGPNRALYAQLVTKFPNAANPGLRRRGVRSTTCGR